MIHSDVGKNQPSPIPSAMEDVTESYLKLDPRYLEEDEIEYELRARKLFDGKMRSLARKTLLIEAILRENEQAMAGPESPYMVTVDIGGCQGMITRLTERIANLRTKQEARQVGAQLTHLKMRVDRIVDEENKSGTELKEIRMATKALIDSFGVVAKKLTVERAEDIPQGPSKPQKPQQGLDRAGHIECQELERGFRSRLTINGNGDANEANRVRREMGNQNVGNEIFMVDGDDNEEEAYVNAGNINADRHFGDGIVQPQYLSSTVRLKRGGQRMDQMFYGEAGQERPSSIRNSNAHSIPMARSVNFNEPDVSQNRMRMFENLQGMRRSSMFSYENNNHERRNNMNEPLARNIDNRTYNVQDNMRYANQIEGSRHDQAKTIPIYRWNIAFSGEEKLKSHKDLQLNEFLYLIKVQKEAHGISDTTMLSQVHHLLTDKAKVWYFAYYDTFESWVQFMDAIRRRFLSEDHAFESRKQVNSQQQKREESPLDFLSRMIMMFRALPVDFHEEMKISIIRRGFMPEIRGIIAPWNIASLRELEEMVARIPYACLKERKYSSNFSKFRVNRRNISVVEKESSDSDEQFELTPEEVCMIKKVRREHERNKSSRGKTEKERGLKTKASKEGIRDSNEISDKREELKCFNCHEKGHFVRDCRKPSRGIFCYGCGKDDVTINKCCRSKNAVDCLDRNPTRSEAETSTDSDN